MQTTKAREELLEFWAKYRDDDLPPAIERAYGPEVARELERQKRLVSLDPRPESGAVAGYLVVAIVAFCVGVLSGMGMR